MDWLQSFATVLLFACSVLQPKASAARIRTCTHKSRIQYTKLVVLRYCQQKVKCVVKIAVVLKLACRYFRVWPVTM